LEAIVGRRTNDLHEALFVVETGDMPLFEDNDDEDFIGLRQFPSRESLGKRRAARISYLSQATRSNPTSPKHTPKALPSSPPQSRSPSRQTRRGPEADAPASPLAKMYSRRPVSMVDVREGEEHSMQEVLAGLRKVEHVMESINDLPVGRLRAEIKDLQVSSCLNGYSFP